MQSKITGGATTPLFKGRVLNKYDVQYYRCNDTGFIQTEKVHWLKEAYGSAITNLDLGLVERNIILSKKILPLFLKHFKTANRFLDYGGGYGMLVRMLRDKGFPFELYDTYCENIFAANLKISSLEGKKFDVITAFEVMEHLDNPIEEFTMLFEHTDNILFSTELVPNKILDGPDSWWYFSQDTGQHIAFYTQKALDFIAKQNGAAYYSDGGSLHLLTKTNFGKNPFSIINRMEKIDFYLNKWRNRMLKWNGCMVRRNTLLDKDIHDELMRQKNA
jgi:hypothetical protein